MATAKGFLVALIVVMAAVIPAVAIHAQGAADRADEGHWWCSSMEPEGPVYITGVWSGRYFTAEVMNSFTQELVAKHAFKGRVNCARANLVSTSAQIESGRSSQVTAWRSSGRKVIEIPWIYDPAKASLPHLCMAYIQVQKGPGTYYLNKILRIPGGTQAQLTTAWSAHIKERHPGAYIPVSGCNLLPADPTQQQTQLDNYAQMYATQKPQVVKYDWSFEPALPVGSVAGKPYAAPVTAAPAAPTTVQYALCWGDAEPTVRYYSAVFDGTKSDYAVWNPAFLKYLEETYKYKGFVRCLKQASRADGEKYRDNLIATARNVTLFGGAKMNIVETGWVYK